MDVQSQEELQGWTLGRWAEYFDSTPSQRAKLHRGGPLNVISLEFSATPLYRSVRSPRLVRQLDWIDNAWPMSLRARGIFPRAQYYCLM